MQTHQARPRLFYYFPWKESSGPQIQSHPVCCGGSAVARRPAALSFPAGSSREIRIQAIFSLVPPTVSHQGKQKSGVLSIYFSL